MKQTIIGTIILFAIGFFFLGDDDRPARKSLTNEDGEVEEVMDPKQIAKEIDAECEEMLKGDDFAEARAWCDPKNANHVGFEMSTKDMLKLANDLYAAGATKVYVADIIELGAKKTSATMVVQLPKDPNARAKVLAREKEFEESEGGEGSPDVGQKYLLMTLD